MQMLRGQVLVANAKQGSCGRSRRRLGARAARTRRLTGGQRWQKAASPPEDVQPAAVPGLPHHFCYALFIPGDESGRTYVGYTVDPARRLRQHNGELKGGAARTRERSGKWRFLFVVAVESDEFGAHEGLSLEWHLKRGRGGYSGRVHSTHSGGSQRRARGVQLRLQLLREALGLQKFNRFVERVAVFVDPAHVDAAWAQLSDLPAPHGCCVMPLPDEWARAPLAVPHATDRCG